MIELKFLSGFVVIDVADKELLRKIMESVNSLVYTHICKDSPTQELINEVKTAWSNQEVPQKKRRGRKPGSKNKVKK
jgi:hypothetical protein